MAASSELLAGTFDAQELQQLFQLNYGLPIEWPAQPLALQFRRLQVWAPLMVGLAKPS